MLRAEAGILRRRGGGGFLRMFLRPPATHRVIRPRSQVHEDIIKVTHHIRTGAERRHDVFLGAVHVLSAAGDDGKKIAVAQRSQGVSQSGGIGRAHAIRSMANMTVGMVAAKTGIRIPVDGAIGLNLVRRAALLVEILAVLLLDGSRISRTVRSGERRPTQSNDERGHRRAKERLHGKDPRAAKMSKPPLRRVGETRRSDLSSASLQPYSRNAKTVSCPPREE